MDKKTLLADFYMYEFICQYGKTDDEILEFDLREEVIEFLDDFKYELKTILEYSIVHELSHIWWETCDYNGLQLPSLGGDRYYVEQHISDESAIILQDFLDEYKRFLPKYEFDKELEGVDRAWAYKRVLDAPENVCTFIRDTKTLFSRLEWRHNFGGKKWKDIAEAYLRLLDAEDYLLDNQLNIFTEIDRILDLQHNTNTIFNKIPSYKDENSYNWLTEFLNFKRDLKDPWELYKYCGKSKKLAAKKLKKLGFGTKEEKEEMSLPPKVQEQLDRLDQQDWSLAKGVITNVVDVDASHLKEMLDEKFDFSDIVEKLKNSLDKFTELQEKVGNTSDEFSETINYVGDNFDDLSSGIADSIETLESNLKEVNDTITEHLIRHTEIIDNIENQIKINTNKIESYLEEQKSELREYIKEQIATVDPAFRTTYELLDEIYEAITTPWYKKLINMIKKIFV